MTSEALDEQ